jgi:hypothetical protein
MEPKTVAKIESAGKDNLSCQWCQLSHRTQLDEIELSWNQSTEAKRRWGQLNRAWLGEMISAGALEIATARDPSGALLVYAGLFRDKHRVQQLLTVSPRPAELAPTVRAKTNRASCFLLWKTMLRLKEQGIQWFDFGGWYPGSDDIQLLGANAFKKGFGGEVIREFECEQILTLKGWVLLRLARFMARAKEFRFGKFSIWDVHPNEATA